MVWAGRGGREGGCRRGSEGDIALTALKAQQLLPQNSSALLPQSTSPYQDSRPSSNPFNKSAFHVAPMTTHLLSVEKPKLFKSLASEMGGTVFWLLFLIHGEHNVNHLWKGFAYLPTSNEKSEKAKQKTFQRHPGGGSQTLSKSRRNQLCGGPHPNTLLVDKTPMRSKPDLRFLLSRSQHVQTKKQEEETQG